MRSGTCPPGTCPVTNTCKYVVWHLSSWHLSGLYIYSPTYTHPPIVGMIYSIPTYIFKNVYSPTLRPKGAQKPLILHSSPKCWHDIFNANIYIQKCIFPNPAPEGRTETLQLAFIPQVLKLYVGIEYIISCQNLGDECELECFSAPFGRRVGEYMSVENIGWYWIYYANT